VIEDVAYDGLVEEVLLWRRSRVCVAALTYRANRPKITTAEPRSAPQRELTTPPRQTRHGFQNLITEIGLGNAELVVSLEASRLARTACSLRKANASMVPQAYRWTYE
jgi:hypothetical protein